MMRDGMMTSAAFHPFIYHTSYGINSESDRPFRQSIIENDIPGTNNAVPKQG
jgi:hypothetical protein